MISIGSKTWLGLGLGFGIRVGVRIRVRIRVRVRARANRLEHLARDGEQRFVRPAVEPVDGAAVDQRGEHAAAHAERAADG